MRRYAIAPFLLLFLIWVCFGTGFLHAQTLSGSGSCPLSSMESDDESVAGVHPRVIVDDLSFDGPIHLFYSDLEPAVETLNQIGRSPDFPWLDEFLETSIRSAWQDRGYFKMLVSGRAEPHGSDAAGQHFSVVLHVDEGPQYRLDNIQFRAEHFYNLTDSGDKPTLRKRREDGRPAPPDLPVFPIEELRSLIPMQEGDILSSEKIRQGLDALRRLYLSHGYIDFTPTPETAIDDDHQTVSIRMVLDEQKQFRVGKIEVAGLGAHAENALVWKIKPGDVFNYDLFKQFFEDNQSVLPTGASPGQNSELYRNTKDGIADIKLKFSACSRQ